MNLLWPAAELPSTQRLGTALARSCPWSDIRAVVLYLSGELGAGKTTLAGALLQELGVQEPVRSPSYALIELYESGQRTAVHVDLYRLSSAAELETLGLRDYLNGQTLLLIEWPERAGVALPPADLQIELATQPSRNATLWAASDAGREWLRALSVATATEVKV